MAPSYLGHTQKTAKQVPASRVDYEAMCPLFREIHLGRRRGRAAAPPPKLALSCKLPLACKAASVSLVDTSSGGIHTAQIHVDLIVATEGASAAANAPYCCSWLAARK